MIIYKNGTADADRIVVATVVPSATTCPDKLYRAAGNAHQMGPLFVQQICGAGPANCSDSAYSDVELQRASARAGELCWSLATVAYVEQYLHTISIELVYT